MGENPRFLSEGLFVRHLCICAVMLKCLNLKGYVQQFGPIDARGAFLKIFRYY